MRTERHAPKVLVIANTFPPLVGGSAAVYEAYCRHQKDRMAVVSPWQSYVTGDPIPGWQETDALQPFQVFRVKSLRPRLRRAPMPVFGWGWRQLTEDIPLRRRIRREVLRVLEHFPAEVVCLGEVYALSWLGLELRAKGIAIVQVIHGEEITTQCPSRQFRREARKALSCVSAIVAVSNFTRDRLLDIGLTQPIHVITNGVETSRFTPGPKSEAILTRHKLHGKRVLLTVARLDEKKGHDNVIRAMPRILASMPDVAYLIVGQGYRAPALASLVQELHLEDQVIFAGNVADSELLDYYRSCDTFVMPNRTLPNGDTEGFGLVFLEAAACGKPVIGGRAGGVVDAVVDKVTGILVDGTSIEEIASAVIRLFGDPDYSAKLASQGLRRSRQHDWSSKAEEFMEVCRSTASLSCTLSLNPQPSNLVE